jgi:hypothetical protein
VVSSIEIPLPAASDQDDDCGVDSCDDGDDLDLGPLAA